MQRGLAVHAQRGHVPGRPRPWDSEESVPGSPRAPTAHADPAPQATAMDAGRTESLSVVYQSRDFLVVNKHWDLRIDSRMWRETPTLQKQLRHRFPELADPDTCYGFRYAGAGPDSPQPLRQEEAAAPSLASLTPCPMSDSATSWTSPPAGRSAWP